MIPNINYNHKYSVIFTSKHTGATSVSLQKRDRVQPATYNYLPTITFGNQMSSPALTERAIVKNKSVESSKINLSQELTPKDVVKILDDQLNIITAEQIEKEILAPFGKADRNLALIALQQMCQFANMDGFNKIVKGLYSLGKSYQPLLIEGGASLSSNLRYLKNKDNFANLNTLYIKKQEFKDYSSNQPYGSVLLDEHLLELLKSDKDYVEFIKNVDMIIYPEGWINGINPFNHASVAEIIHKLQTIVAKAKQIQLENKLDSCEAVKKALNDPITEDLERMGLLDKLRTIHSTNLNEQPTVNEIEKLLAPDKISEKVLEKIIKENIPQDYRQLVFKLLVSEAKVFSPRTLSIALKQQYENIKKMAAEKGIKEENIYYLIPETFKSFDFVTMAYKITNNIPAEKIIDERTSNHFDYDIPDKENIMLVVLDDLAGSGNSFESMYSILRSHLSKKTHSTPVECVLAPLVLSDKAETLFKQMIEKEKTTISTEEKPPQTRLSYCPTILIKSLENSDFFKALNERDQKLVLKAIFSKGFCRNAFNIVFPYGSPDNNNALFGNFLAEHFTLNKKGVSKNDKISPMWEEIDV